MAFVRRGPTTQRPQKINYNRFRIKDVQIYTSSFSEDIGAYPLYDLDEDPFSIGIVTKCSEVSVSAYSISVVTMLRKKQ